MASKTELPASPPETRLHTRTYTTTPTQPRRTCTRWAATRGSRAGRGTTGPSESTAPSSASSTRGQPPRGATTRTTAGTCERVRACLGGVLHGTRSAASPLINQYSPRHIGSPHTQMEPPARGGGGAGRAGPGTVPLWHPRAGAGAGVQVRAHACASECFVSLSVVWDLGADRHHRPLNLSTTGRSRR